jgi:hypothetical protein
LAKEIGRTLAAEEVKAWAAQSPDHLRFQDENGVPIIYEWTGKNFVQANDDSDPDQLYIIRSIDASPLNAHALKLLRPSTLDQVENDFRSAVVDYEYNDDYVNRTLKTLFDQRHPDPTEKFVQAEDRAAKALLELGKKMGLTFKVDTSMDVKAAIDLVNKIVYFQSQSPDYETLAEEISHAMIDILKSKNRPLYEGLRKAALESDVYREVKETYADVYSTEEEFEVEAMGKIFSQIVQVKIHPSWRTAFFSWLASKFKEWATYLKAYFQGYKDYIRAAYDLDFFVDDNETYVPSELKLFSLSENVRSIQKRNFRTVVDAFLRKQIVRPYYAVTSLLRDKPSKRDILVGKTLEELWKNKTLVEEGENEYISIDEDDPLTEIKKQLGIAIHRFVEIVVEDFENAKSKGGYAFLDFERYYDAYLEEYGVYPEKKDLVQLRASLSMLYESLTAMLKDADEVLTEFPVYFNASGKDVYGRIDLVIRKGSVVNLVDFKTSFNHEISQGALEKAQKQLSLYKSIFIDQIHQKKIPFNDLSVGTTSVLNFILKLRVKAKGENLTRKIYREDGTFRELLNLTTMESWLAKAELDENGLFKSLTDPSTPSVSKIVLPYDIPFAQQKIPGSLEQKAYSYVPKSLVKDKLETMLKMQRLILERIINEAFVEDPSQVSSLNIKKIRIDSFLDTLKGIAGDEELEAYFTTEKGKYLPLDLSRLLKNEVEEFFDYFQNQKVLEFEPSQSMYAISRRDYTTMPTSFFHRLYYYSEMSYMYKDLLSFFNAIYSKDKATLLNFKGLEYDLENIDSIIAKLANIVTAQFVYKGFDTRRREDLKIPIPENMSQDDLDNLFFTPDGFLNRQGMLFTSVLHSKNKVESFLGRFLIEADVITKSNTAEAFKYIDKLALLVDDYDVFYQKNEKGRLTGNIVSPENYAFIETANRMVQEPGEETAKFADESVFFVIGDLLTSDASFSSLMVDGKKVASLNDVKNSDTYKKFKAQALEQGLYDEETFDAKIKEGYDNAVLFLQTRKVMMEKFLSLYGGKELQTHIDLYDNAVNPFMAYKKFKEGKPVRGNSSLQFTVVMNKDKNYVDPEYFKLRKKFEENEAYKKLWQFYHASVARYRQISETGGVQAYSFFQRVMIPETEATVLEWLQRFLLSRSAKPEMRLFSLIKERFKRFLQSFVYTRLGLIDESVILNSGRMLVRPIPAYMLKENFGSARKSYDLSKVLKKMHSDINHVEGLQHLDSLLSVMVNTYYRYVENKFAGEEAKSFHVRYGRMTDFLAKRIYKTPERVQFTQEQLAERKTVIQAGTKDVRLVRDIRGAMYKKLAYLTSLSTIGYSVSVGMANLMSAFRNYLILASLGREIKMPALLASIADVTFKGTGRRFLKYAYRTATGLKPSLQDKAGVEAFRRKAFKYVSLLDQLGFDFSGTADFSGYNVKGTTKTKLGVLSKATEFAVSPFSIMRGTEMMAAVVGLQSVLRSLKYEYKSEETTLEEQDVADLEAFSAKKLGVKKGKAKVLTDPDTGETIYVFSKGRVKINADKTMAETYRKSSFYDRLYVDKDTGLSFLTTRDGRKIKLAVSEDGKIYNALEEEKEDFDAIMQDLKDVAVAFAGITSRVQGEFLVSTPIYGKNYLIIKAFLQFKVWLISELRNRFSPRFFDSTLLISRTDPKTGETYIQKGGYRKGYYYALASRLKRKLLKARTSEELLDDYSNYKAAVVIDLMTMSFLNGVLAMLGTAISAAFAPNDETDDLWAKIARALAKIDDDEYLDLEKERLIFEELAESENAIFFTDGEYVNDVLSTFLHNLVLQQGKEATSFTSAITSLGDEGDLYRLIVPASISYAFDAVTTLTEASLYSAYNVNEDKDSEESVYFSPFENYFAYAIPKVYSPSETPDDESVFYYRKDYNPTLRIREDMIRLTPFLSSLRSTRRMLTRRNETVTQKWLRKNRNKLARMN